MSIEEIVKDLRAIEAYGELPISSYEAGNYADEIEALLAENVKLKEGQIDAEPVRHGHWIEAHDNDGLDYECSNRKCQCRISYNGAKVSGDFNYCPNCGAKMDEEVEHEAD